MTLDVPADGYLDPRDLAYTETLVGEEREAAVATVRCFRRPDRLRVGDPIPRLELLRLTDGARVELASLVGDRPAVLVFGSFT
jgi:hypothetical protein